MSEQSYEEWWLSTDGWHVELIIYQAIVLLSKMNEKKNCFAKKRKRDWVIDVDEFITCCKQIIFSSPCLIMINKLEC